MANLRSLMPLGGTVKTTKTQGQKSALNRADHDVVAIGIMVAACLLFVGIGGPTIGQTINAWLGTGKQPQPALVSALLLNIALIIFGWRRYDELGQEVRIRSQAEAEARILAATDPLTGCLNRRSTPTVIAAMGGQAARSGQKIAALLFDLDNFKNVNDLNGHRAGDSLLVDIARRVSTSIPPEAKLARLGGDEFCCFMLFDPQQPERVDMVALNILQTVSSPLSVEEYSFDVTASIGIAQTCGTSPSSAERVIHEADIAMYQAKKAGRNRYSWFNPAMESELRIRSDLESSIRKGIAEGEFVPHYQRQVDIHTGDLVGFEMLAHWQAPHMNGISPDIFIPVAEEIGAISALSESLIRVALNDAKQWDPRLVLSVNISPVQLRDPWFSQKLLRMLVESGFPPERLEIEITESCLHDQIGTVRSMITSLKNQGIRISLDDFGSGYSSLAQLRSLPFDRLKIDRSFVTGLADDEANRKLVEAIVSLAKGLNLPITAEGIESEPVHQVLRSMGAMKGQGFLYGKPQGAQETLAMLAEHNLLIVPLEQPSPDDLSHSPIEPKREQAG